MASDKVLKYLTDKYGEYNYKIRLTDFTDDDVRKAIKESQPRDWYDIEDYLYAHADSDEVRAHLKGFDSAEERREAIQHIKNLQKRLYDMEEKL